MKKVTIAIIVFVKLRERKRYRYKMSMFFRTLFIILYSHKMYKI